MPAGGNSSDHQRTHQFHAIPSESHRISAFSFSFIVQSILQAIHCSLVGIQPLESDGKWLSSVCDKIYDEILADGANLFAKLVAFDDKPKRCAVILKDVQERGPIDINRLIVEKGFGEMDPQSGDFLLENDFIDLKPDAQSENSVESDYEHISPPAELQVDDDLDTQEHEDDDVASSLNSYDMTFDFEEKLALLENHGLPKEMIERLKSHHETQSSQSQSLSNIAKSTSMTSLNTKSKSDLLSLPSIGNDSNDLMQASSLRYVAKVPKVIWAQTRSRILLKISANEDVKYNLRVTDSCLSYTCKGESGTQDQSLLIHLFGLVEPAMTHHKVRGLNVVVHLVKSLKQFLWPRMLAMTDKTPWLSYDYDAIAFVSDVLEFDGAVSEESDDEKGDGGICSDQEDIDDFE